MTSHTNKTDTLWVYYMGYMGYGFTIWVYLGLVFWVFGFNIWVYDMGYYMGLLYGILYGIPYGFN